MKLRTVDIVFLSVNKKNLDGPWCRIFCVLARRVTRKSIIFLDFILVKETDYPVTLNLCYLIYLMSLPVGHYAYGAVQESKSLLRNGFSCWIADLNWVISHLPGGLASGTDVADMDIPQLLSLQKAIGRHCDAHLTDALMGSTKCYLLKELGAYSGPMNVVSSVNTLCCLSSRHTRGLLLQFCSQPMVWQWSASAGGNDTGTLFRESGVCVVFAVQT